MGGEGRKTNTDREKHWREWLATVRMRVSHPREKNNRKNERATDRERKDKRQRKCGVIWKIVAAWLEKGGWVRNSWKWGRGTNKTGEDGEKDEKENARLKRRVLGGVTRARVAGRRRWWKPCEPRGGGGEGWKYETAFLKMRFGAHLLRCERRRVGKKVEGWKETTTVGRHETCRGCWMGGEGKDTGVVRQREREKERSGKTNRIDSLSRVSRRYFSLLPLNRRPG